MVRISKSAKSSQSSATLGFEQQIWNAACELWGHIPAADYRKIFTGLIFLRYISAAFEKRYNELVAEGEGFEEDLDEYVSENIFFVPQNARWSEIAKAAHTPEIGKILDQAMIEVEKNNKALKGVLPKNYAAPDLDKRVLGNVVDVFSNMDMSDTEASKDLLGRTYEYCIAQFASYEGVKGGEFYTPASVVKTIVSILKPSEGKRVYDPCCGSGGMFVQSIKFIQDHSGNRNNVSVYGQEANADTWKMAKMNMAIRGIDANFGEHHEDTFFHDLHANERFDFIMANPPFNLKNWGQEQLQEDPRWQYGLPPADNANYAWIQHMIYHLSPKGKIGLVLANSALNSSAAEEFQIRKKIIEDNFIEAIIALPSQLFFSTKIKVSIWILNRAKVNNNIVFVDAQEFGHMIDKKQKVFSDEEIEVLANTVLQQKTKEGFSRTVGIDVVREKNYNLVPRKYLSKSGEEVDFDNDFDEKLNINEKYVSSLKEEGLTPFVLNDYKNNKQIASLIKNVSELNAEESHLLARKSFVHQKKKKVLDANINDLIKMLFVKWFVNFEFDEKVKFKRSELGDIPEDWEIEKMGHLLESSNEKVGIKSDVLEYSVTNNGLVLRSENFTKKLSANSSKNKIIKNNDIIFGMSREIFNFGIMTDEVGSVSPAYHVYHIDTKRLNIEFLESYMRICSEYFLSLIKPGAREGQVLDKEELIEKKIILPPLSIQEKFVVLKNNLSNWLFKDWF